MQHPDELIPQPSKPDLKHDTMEYNAATDGEDVLDTDTASALEIEDESISAEELELLEEDSVDDQAAALITAETDSAADEDNFFVRGRRGHRSRLS